MLALVKTQARRYIAQVSEVTDVLSAISALHSRGERMALATIISVRGSTYRRPGARLLIPAQGDPIGNISGGCLEGDVERIGREVMVTGRPRLELFDLTADGDEVWGYGLGCNGAMELFIEPAEHVAASAAALRTAVEQERPCCLATVVESSVSGVAPGARLLLQADGQAEGRVGGQGETEILAAARRSLDAGASSVERLSVAGKELRVFLEVLQPPLRLLICGAGHDAIPLVRFAAQLGWRVVVADPRPVFLTVERFPAAAELLDAVGADLFAHTYVDERTYPVVMTHNYLRDMEYLRVLIDSRAPYIGILGPRRRAEQLLDELAGQGVVPSGAPPHDRIHAPAGLDLGAEGPAEIAWAIVAEVLAVHRGRAGGPLRERRAPIHAEEDEHQPLASAAEV
ncbi:XdhC family protein [soil metagenome]